MRKCHEQNDRWYWWYHYQKHIASSGKIILNVIILFTENIEMVGFVALIRTKKPSVKMIHHPFLLQCLVPICSLLNFFFQICLSCYILLKITITWNIFTWHCCRYSTSLSNVIFDDTISKHPFAQKTITYSLNGPISDSFLNKTFSFLWFF